MAPKPFTVAISDDDIVDLHQRLDRARWPDQLNTSDWAYGTDLATLQALVHYWRHDFDWRQQEAALNRYNQFTLAFDGLTTHFIHQRSPHANATPLLINHGWPGSIVEFLDVLPRLLEPEKFGGRVEDAFHVVAPSLPGYAFSEAAKSPGMHTRAIAERHSKLMALLGYDSYLCQGGDWGAMITRQLADLDPQHCKGVHFNMLLAGPPADGDPMAGLSEQERQRLQGDAAFAKEGMGYYKLQATRPQTLGYGLNDSPVGLCAWLTEKFYSWTDCDGDIRNAVSWDRLLTNISLYWFTQSITSSTRLYYEHRRHKDTVQRVKLPTGATIYPGELVRPPRAWAEASYNLIHWFEAEKGGHFAALEQPQVFAEELWRFAQALQTRGDLPA